MRRRNPYKLFDYYEETDADVFFGREAEVGAVVGDILANKLLVLFARSGSGKTSLLNAGIGPALRDIGQGGDEDSGIRMVTIRLSGKMTPEESAIGAIRSALGSAGPAADESLHAFLTRQCKWPGTADPRIGHPPVKPPMGLVLVFDQFEELFISLFRDRPQDRRQLGNVLASIINDQSLRAYVVLSLRCEHFHHLHEFRAAIPSIFQNNTNLELHPFSREAALRVILGPAERTGSGFSWQSGLPERIVDDLAQLNDHQDGILPIHLQIVCHGLWERLAADEREITHTHYDGATDDVSRRLKKPPAYAMARRRIVMPLSAVKGRPRKRCLCRMLRALMGNHESKIPRSVSEMSEIIPKRQLGPLLQYLEEQQILRRIVSESDVWYELRHDYLACAMAPWVQEAENRLRRGDRLRMGVGVAVLLAVAALATMAYRDWHTYRASLGVDDQRPDELIIERRRALGAFAPSWWKRVIHTGLLRPQLLAGGVRRHTIPVDEPLSDWKDVGEQLEQETRWTLQLATRLGPRMDGQVDTGLFEVSKHGDIDLLARADERTLRLLVSTVRFGNKRAKLDAIRAVGRLGEYLTPRDRPVLMNALLEELKSPAGNRRSATMALLSLARRGLEDRASEIVDATLDPLLNGDLDSERGNLRLHWQELLAELATRPRAKPGAAVVDRLLEATAHPGRQANALSLLGPLGKLQQSRLPEVIDALAIGLNSTNEVVRQSAIRALSLLANEVPQARLLTVVDALLGVPKNNAAVAKALGNFMQSLPPERLGAVMNWLESALKTDSTAVKEAAAGSLAAIGFRLAPARLARVICSLLHEWDRHDKDFQLEMALRKALSKLTWEAPSAHSPRLVEALVGMLDGKDAAAKNFAVAVLAHRSEDLPASLLPRIFDALLESLFAAKHMLDPDWAVVRAVVDLEEELPPERLSRVADRLTRVLKDRRSKASSVMAYLLGGCGNLPPTRLVAVVDALLDALKEGDSDMQKSAAIALRFLGTKLPSGQLPQVLDALRAVVTNGASAEKARRAAGQTLIERLEKVPGELIPGSLIGVLATDATSSREALVRFAKSSPKRLSRVVEELVGSLERLESDWSAYAITLGDLGKDLPRQHTPRVVKALLKRFKEAGSGDRGWAADALVKLKDEIPETNLSEVIAVLLEKLDSAAGQQALGALAGLYDRIPYVRLPEVVAAIVHRLNRYENDRDEEVVMDDGKYRLPGSAHQDLAVALARVATMTTAESAPSVFLDLELAAKRGSRADSTTVAKAIRLLAAARWPQSDGELLRLFEHDDSRWRAFALHVLARRGTLSDETLARIRGLRDDAKGRPWVKLTALRCLVEIEREKQTRKEEMKEENARSGEEE